MANEPEPPTTVSRAALYRSVIRAMAEGVVVHAEDGRIIEANPAAQRILGISLAMMTGLHPIDPRWRLVLADGTAAPASAIPSEITRITGVACRNHRLGVHRPSGELAWLSVNTDIVEDVHVEDGPRDPAVPEPSKAGRVGRVVVATFTDITDVVSARAQLEAERSHLRRVIDLAPGVVFQLTRDRFGQDRLTFISERAQAVLGVPPIAIRSDPGSLHHHIHTEDLARTREIFARSATTGTPISTDLRFLRPPDQWIWIRVHAIADQSEAGTTWTGIIMDITADRVVEERLRRAARREAMGELAAGLAHNFNNLLAAILPNIELALASPNPEPGLLEDALQATRSAADLVRQLLAFTRNDACESARAPVELTALVRETMRFCRKTFDSRISILVDVAEGPSHVLGQASNLQQVIMNLCLNARDAVAQVERPRIEVTLARVAEDEVGLTVMDNGVGMDPDVVRRLGEPFFTTKGPGLGTGLGLATVYGIVREARGQIQCRTTPGVGTTFDIRLPTVTVDAVVETRVEPVQRRLDGLVLVVDDERLVRSALRRMLASAGLAVIEAPDGRSALDLLVTSRRRPDLILLDLSMPGMSGEEVLEELVRFRPRIPVIVISGHRGSSVELEGAFCVLRKPVEHTQLIDNVALALART